MLSKSYSKTRKSCRVTFKLPSERVPAATAAGSVVGDFNAWDGTSHPLKKRKDGSFSTTVSVEAGRNYRFRYLFSDGVWIDDDAPDGVVANSFGSHDCLLEV
jgi:1,4-alpha-glucan branching enzyme